MSRLASKAGSIRKKKTTTANKKTKTGYGTDDTNGVQAQEFQHTKRQEFAGWVFTRI